MAVHFKAEDIIHGVTLPGLPRRPLPMPGLPKNAAVDHHERWSIRSLVKSHKIVCNEAVFVNLCRRGDPAPSGASSGCLRFLFRFSSPRMPTIRSSGRARIRSTFLIASCCCAKLTSQGLTRRRYCPSMTMAPAAAGFRPSAGFRSICRQASGQRPCGRRGAGG